MKFKYKAHNPGEETFIEGEAEAVDRFALSHQMRERGLLLITADQIDGRWFDFERLNEAVVSVKLHDKVIFANNLGAMIAAGLSLSRALEILGRQTNNLKLKRTIGDILKDVNSGMALNGSLAKFPKIFSPVFIAMVAAGEESGNLPQSLRVVSDQMSKTYTLTRKVKGAMAYPAVILTAMIAIAFLMLTFVVPNLVSTFKEFNVELPFLTRVIIWLSDILASYWYYVFVGSTLLIYLFYRLFKTARGKRMFEYTILHLPFISGIVKQMNSATTTRTLSSLISSGVNMVEALDITARVVQNSYYKDVLIRARDGVQKGDSLSSFFQREQKLFPILVGELVEVGEETGKLSDMLSNVAVFYEDEVEALTKDMSTIIEPVLMIIIGLFVGLFAVSMIQPIYSITSSI